MEELDRDAAIISRELNTYTRERLWTENNPHKTAVDIDVYFKQYGAINHQDRACDQLKGPKIGQVFEGR